ncbi:MAG: hypothetical protein E6713_02335 [Sporomusaceae bacterium]|nr:hypothetical protein [Sporomusaceae bacterium]
MPKRLLLLFFAAFLLLGTHPVFAAIYIDKDNAFQMTTPPNWTVMEQYTVTGKTIVLTPSGFGTTAIIASVAPVDPLDDSHKSFADYNEAELTELIDGIKQEIFHTIPSVTFEKSQIRLFGNNKALLLNYRDKEKKYCLAEFLQQDRLYMFIFSAPPQEYQETVPPFFQMLTSIQFLAEAGPNQPSQDIPLI